MSLKRVCVILCERSPGQFLRDNQENEMAEQKAEKPFSDEHVDLMMGRASLIPDAVAAVVRS